MHSSRSEYCSKNSVNVNVGKKLKNKNRTWGLPSEREGGKEEDKKEEAEENERREGNGREKRTGRKEE